MEIYVDASFGSTGYHEISSGGLGILSVKDKPQAIAIRVSGENLNIIRLEALAIHAALIIYSNEQNITIYTDNQHCYESLVTLREYYTNNEWRRVNNQHIAELDIILQCEELIDRRRQNSYKTTIKKVVSHSGNTHHDAADKLAYAAMTNQKGRVQNFMNIAILNYSKFSIAKIREFVPQYLKIAIDDISREMKRLNINIQTIISNNEKVDEKPIAAQCVKYTFILCHSCAEIVLFENISTSSSLIDVVSLTRLTQCKTCTKNYGQVNDTSKIMNITRFIFYDSDIYDLITKVGSLHSEFTVRPLLSSYKELNSILDIYNYQYTISSIDTKNKSRLNYLKSGFF